jgi:hypothetical protein
MHFQGGFTPELDQPPNKEALHKNSKVVWGEFQLVILARLLALQGFLEAMEACCIPEKEGPCLWLLFQTAQQPLFSTDILDDLVQDLCTLPCHYISERLDTVAWAVKGKVCSLCVVVDEAQFAAKRFPQGFFSESAGQPRPILRELVKAWGRVPGFSILVLCGMGISESAVQEAVGSATAKGPELMTLHDTGLFDREQKQVVYISKYLWPHKTQGGLSSDECHLLQRAWRWVRGR